MTDTEARALIKVARYLAGDFGLSDTFDQSAADAWFLLLARVGAVAGKHPAGPAAFGLRVPDRGPRDAATCARDLARASWSGMVQTALARAQEGE